MYSVKKKNIKENKLVLSLTPVNIICTWPPNIFLNLTALSN